MMPMSSFLAIDSLTQLLLSLIDPVRSATHGSRRQRIVDQGGSVSFCGQALSSGRYIVDCGEMAAHQTARSRHDAVVARLMVDAV
jgi:hypothetical protein